MNVSQGVFSYDFSVPGDYLVESTVIADFNETRSTDLSSRDLPHMKQVPMSINDKSKKAKICRSIIKCRLKKNCVQVITLYYIILLTGRSSESVLIGGRTDGQSSLWGRILKITKYLIHIILIFHIYV